MSNLYVLYNDISTLFSFVDTVPPYGTRYWDVYKYIFFTDGLCFTQSGTDYQVIHYNEVSNNLTVREISSGLCKVKNINRLYIEKFSALDLHKNRDTLYLDGTYTVGYIDNGWAAHTAFLSTPFGIKHYGQPFTSSFVVPKHPSFQEESDDEGTASADFKLKQTIQNQEPACHCKHLLDGHEQNCQYIQWKRRIA